MPRGHTDYKHSVGERVHKRGPLPPFSGMTQENLIPDWSYEGLLDVLLVSGGKSTLIIERSEEKIGRSRMGNFSPRNEFLAVNVIFIQ